MTPLNSIHSSLSTNDLDSDTTESTESLPLDSDLLLLDECTATKPQHSCYKRSTAYIFNNRLNNNEMNSNSPSRSNHSSEHKKEFDFEVTDIYKNYELSDDFLKTIDWEKERVERPSLNGWRSIRPFSPDDERPFLLPQVSLFFSPFLSFPFILFYFHYRFLIFHS
jgi:hypothetical protein